jgi:16S rRNA G966 N2-methylase RsmD
MKKQESKLVELEKLYNTPLPSNRTGALYNAFSYPTKISPETIAIFIACHTNIGDTILDPFAGSGTTGLGAKLCEAPNPAMIAMAEKFGLKPKWGKRNVVLYELSTLGAFVADTLCNPPSSVAFENIAHRLIKEVEKELGHLYDITDDQGNPGTIRHVIWSEVLVCSNCKNEVVFWDACVQEHPVVISTAFTCPSCQHTEPTSKMKRLTMEVYDDLLQETCTVKKRVPVKIYGRTKKRTWSRTFTDQDMNDLNDKLSSFQLDNFPVYKINWGVLYRKGYHQGITHLHHFYTRRNALVFSKLWNKINNYPEELRNALKLLLLSYNSSHSTLMTRVVVKKDSPDFVITGAQSGVLYISNLPIEKNILEGIKRKIGTLKQAFQQIDNCQGTVKVVNASSTQLNLAPDTIDYVFTDPPFGDYIPYSEINQLNEAWLGNLTDPVDEVIVNVSQKKSVADYHNLMFRVLSEVSRTLKDTSFLSLVFHSAQSEIWKALIAAYQKAGLNVITSSILDKIQSSFKQTNSTVMVKGDPILMLSKSWQLMMSVANDDLKDLGLINKLLHYALVETNDPDEQKPERLFARYINACLEAGKPVYYDARAFYQLIDNEMSKYQFSN